MVRVVRVVREVRAVQLVRVVSLENKHSESMRFTYGLNYQILERSRDAMHVTQ